jgi:hypothetical protein
MPHLHYAPIWRRTGWDRREGPFSEHDLKRLPVVVWVRGTDVAAPLASTPGPLADEPSVHPRRLARAYSQEHQQRVQ